MHSKLAIVGGLIILLLVNYSIINKEKHLAEGTVVYLELAPVDPRSLMQGDYMALRFGIENEVRKALNKQGIDLVDSSDGKVIVSIDDKKIASFTRLSSAGSGEDVVKHNEIEIMFRVRDSRVKFATNAFFFQEGKAEQYSVARYGQFRVSDKGELLLVEMYDKDLNNLAEVISK